MIYKIYSVSFFWMPLAFIVFQMIIEVTIPRAHLSVIHSENGLHELLQFFILVLALVVALTGAKQTCVQNNISLMIWFLWAAVCSAYVAGEEISWGQSFLNWPTPEYWSNINDQGETNLHNTSSWLDQKPRLLLEIGVIIGGLFVPFILRFKSQLLPQKFSIIYPSSKLALTAFIFLALKLIDKADSIGFTPFERISEVQELYLFYFVLLYLIELRGRVAD